MAATIYVVDDDAAARDSLKLLLETYGLEVKESASTREFLYIYQPGDQQCLILDHQLADEKGLDFIESTERERIKIPVILVSGGGDRKLKDRGLKDGAYAYFDKPLDNSLLLPTIFKAVGLTA